MNSAQTLSFEQLLYYRLIAMWVICEGVAGGIMHGFNIPFTGMIISGFAVICICLIGHCIRRKGTILKATIIVMVFKMMLSPHAPPTAYVAVLFQGFTGQLLFSTLKNNYRLACIFLAILALLESAMQRLIILVLVYGNDFWKATNEFIRKGIGSGSVTNITWWLAVGYFLIHAVVGILIGILAARIIDQSGQTEKNNEFLITGEPERVAVPIAPRQKKKVSMRTLFLIAWLILALLFLQSVFKIGSPVLPANKAFRIFIRSLLIFFTWYFLVSPLITRWIRKRLQKQREHAENDIQQVLLLLPETEYIFRKAWQMSSRQKGFSRLKLFWKIIIANVLGRTGS